MPNLPIYGSSRGIRGEMGEKAFYVKGLIPLYLLLWCGTLLPKGLSCALWSIQQKQLRSQLPP